MLYYAEPFSNLNDLNKSSHTRRYLNTIHPNQYVNKISNVNDGTKYLIITLKRCNLKRMYLM